jgi:hypothetical protein
MPASDESHQAIAVHLKLKGIFGVVDVAIQCMIGTVERAGRYKPVCPGVGAGKVKIEGIKIGLHRGYIVLPGEAGRLLGLYRHEQNTKPK